MSTDITKSTLERIQFVRSMMEEGFDWKGNHYPSFDEEFRSLINKKVEGVEYEKYVECGSYRPNDPVSALFRLLWLIEPSGVDFSDMYKTRLFSFMSIDARVIITVELYKYEPALYFYAPKSSVDSSNTSGVWCGVPGADNGQLLTDETGNAFIEMVKKAVSTPHMIYGGNKFEV